MFPSCEKQLTKASATARFAGGRGIELLTHAIMTTYPLNVNAIKKLVSGELVSNWCSGYNVQEGHTEKHNELQCSSLTSL